VLGDKVIAGTTADKRQDVETVIGVRSSGVLTGSIDRARIRAISSNLARCAIAVTAVFVDAKAIS
jgi:hypothetical protein